MTEFGRQLLRLLRSWRTMTLGVTIGLLGLAIQNLVEGMSGDALTYLLLAFLVPVCVALVAAFDWSWIAGVLYRVSVVTNAALVLFLGNITDTKKVALALLLFVSAFLAGLHAARQESDH